MLEVVLALAVAGAITIMGFRTYNYYSFDTHVRYLQQNVETLMNAAAMFYQANCASTLATTTSPYVLNITSQLVTPGYLSYPWGEDKIGPIVKTSDPTGGFVVQYNLLPTTSAVMNVDCSSGDCSSTTSPKIYPQALVSTLQPLLWEIQVSVKVNTNISSAQMTYILGMTGASCLTNSGSGSTINNCRSPGSAPYTWIAWTQLPSLASPHSLSPHWLRMPSVKQFNLQYTHDQMFELSNQTYIDNGNGHSQGYYTCGS
jgi:hypothetical protein